MDEHDTRLMTDVQYLAPLMAYFNPKQHPDSKVLTLDDGKCLLVPHGPQATHIVGDPMATSSPHV